MKTLLTFSCIGGLLFSVSIRTLPAQESTVGGKGIAAETVAAYEKLGGVYGGWQEAVAYLFFEMGKPLAEKLVPGFTFALPPNCRVAKIVAEVSGLSLSNRNTGSVRNGCHLL